MSRASEGILEARPRRIAAPAEGRAGADALGLGAGRDGVLVVPRSLAAGPPAPLLLLLHGAGGRGRDMVGPFAA